MDPADLERDNLLNKQIGNPCENHPSDHYSLSYHVALSYHPTEEAAEDKKALTSRLTYDIEMDI